MRLALAACRSGDKFVVTKLDRPAGSAEADYGRVMKRSDAARDREHDDGRNWFERFVEQAQQLVSRAPFFLICVCIIVAWAASLPLFGDVKTWMGLIHTVSSVLSLLLLVLLENSGRRAEEAAQEKLNVLAEGAVGPDGVTGPG